MKKTARLKLLLFLSALLLSVSLPLFGDVVLTDQEYDQIMTALDQSEAELMNNNNLMMKLGTLSENSEQILSNDEIILERLDKLPNESDKIMTRQSEALEPLEKSLNKLETENLILKTVTISSLIVIVIKLVYDFVKDLIIDSKT